MAVLPWRGGFSEYPGDCFWRPLPLRANVCHRDKMTAGLGSDLVNLMPKSTVAEQTRRSAAVRFSASGACTRLKVDPLFQAFRLTDTWLTVPATRPVPPTRANLKQEEVAPVARGREFAYQPHWRQGHEGCVGHLTVN